MHRILFVIFDFNPRHDFIGVQDHIADRRDRARDGRMHHCRDEPDAGSDRLAETDGIAFFDQGIGRHAEMLDERHTQFFGRRQRCDRYFARQLFVVRRMDTAAKLTQTHKSVVHKMTAPQTRADGVFICYNGVL